MKGQSTSSSGVSQAFAAADPHRREMLKRIADLDSKYEDPKKTFEYGTAGFRDKARLLDRVFFRIGIVAALRAK